MLPFPAFITDFIVNHVEVVIYSEDKVIKSIPKFFKTVIS